MWDSLLAIAFGVLVLFMFYRAVRTEWPDSYLSVETRGLEFSIISHPVRYVLFRFLPTFLVCVFVAVSLDRAHTNPVGAVLAICVIHAAMNNGAAIWRMAHQPAGARDTPLLLMHVVIAGGLVVVGVLALVTRNTFEEFVPTLDELGATLWTAAFAGVVGTDPALVARPALHALDKPATPNRRTIRARRRGREALVGLGKPSVETPPARSTTAALHPHPWASRSKRSRSQARAFAETAS
jgi:hypothetical protein